MENEEGGEEVHGVCVSLKRPPDTPKQTHSIHKHNSVFLRLIYEYEKFELSGHP